MSDTGVTRRSVTLIRFIANEESARDRDTLQEQRLPTSIALVDLARAHLNTGCESKPVFYISHGEV